ncbi:MAG: F0F1 ATP synthase subunit delta [Peptococcaceae bacterium]
MNIRTVAKRYAQALSQIAQERNTLDQYEKELNDILAAVNADDHLTHIWFSERILTDDKKQVFGELFSGKISEIIVNFLFVLIDKNREALLPDIFKEYQRLADISRNIIDAEVRSAAQLTTKDFEELQAKLSAMTGKNVRLKVEIDAALIGGLIVKIGDKVIDGSVIKRLAVMKKKLNEIQFSKIGVRD